MLRSTISGLVYIPVDAKADDILTAVVYRYLLCQERVPVPVPVPVEIYCGIPGICVM